MEAVRNRNQLILIKIQFHEALKPPELGVRKLPNLVGMEVEYFKAEAKLADALR